MKTRKIPLRMCVGCREMKNKLELIRIVRSKEGAVSVDKSSKAAGRGAYICNNAQCLEKAIKTKALSRALETQIDSPVYDKLREEVSG